MSFWETIWSDVIALVFVAIVLGLGGIAVQKVRLRLGRRPDFVLRLRGAGQWEMQRTRRSNAYEIKMNHGYASGPLHQITESSGDRGDLASDEIMTIGFASNLVWFSWIDRGGRKYSKTIDVADGSTSFRITGLKVDRDGVATT